MSFGAVALLFWLLADSAIAQKKLLECAPVIEIIEESLLVRRERPVFTIVSKILDTGNFCVNIILFFYYRVEQHSRVGPQQPRHSQADGPAH